MDCLDDDWIDNEVDDRGLLEVLDGLNDGITNDDDDHELLRDMDCLDGGGIDSDVDDRDLLGAMVNLSTERAIMSYLRTWIALMTMGLTVMLTIVDY